MTTTHCLQHYFERENDSEAASIVAEVVALLPSNSSRSLSNKAEEKMDENVVLNNILLTKESEIAALKEVILKWRNRALEAESNHHYQLEFIHLQHQRDLKTMESRYTRKLDEKQEIIDHLEEQVGYLVSRRSSSRDTYQEEDVDTASIVSSIYDRDAEHQHPLMNENTTSSNLKSEAILDSIQGTMRAIEQELSNKTRVHRRSPSSSTYYSSATLIDSQSPLDAKIKKSPLFIHRIFKKAFPKLYKKNLKCNNKKSFSTTTSGFPRSGTDETLGAYSTTSTVAMDENHTLMNYSHCQHSVAMVN